MKRSWELFVWLLLAAVGAGLLAWAYPRLFPFLPERWTVDKDRAEAIALARFEDLGPVLDGPFVVTMLATDQTLDRRLWVAAREGRTEELRGHPVAAGALAWEVTMSAAGARADEWAYRARVSPGGEITALRRSLPGDEGEGAIDAAEASRRADAFLVGEGFDLAAFQAPRVRSRQLADRTDYTLRYVAREELLGPEAPYGVEVAFGGTELLGFSRFVDDPASARPVRRTQDFALIQQLWLFLPVVLAPVVGVFFLRRYHAGEVGVRRGLKIFSLSFAGGLSFVALSVKPLAANWSYAIDLNQMQWIASFQMIVFYFMPLAGIAFLSWSVGEVWSRERAPYRLAAFDGLFRGQWANATVARASLRGLCAGVALAGVTLAAAWLLSEAGAWVPVGFFFGPWWEGSSWFGVALLAFTLPAVLYQELFGRLLLVSVAVGRLGRWAGGALAAAVAALIFFPPVLMVPYTAGLALAAASAAVSVALFLRYGLATALLSSLTASLLLDLFPFLVSGHPWLGFQATLPLLAVAAPLLVSIRHLTTDEELTYRYDDVPAHVRRIAERERQRIELETARRIQSSILPEVPPSLNGVEIAHAYLPATEVGGDFYDVLALEDGRLALAVGDVAGHGVSSGLVMSAVKSALAVQVTFNPEVEAVFTMLNRVVYQSARKRLLATLCYALLDPVRRELLYASAGHLYPYLISDGRVAPLEYVAYPLGVRGQVSIQARLAHLKPDDTLFLLSDGLVEARAEGSEDLFGFSRLEESLACHATLPVGRLRDAVLADVERHTRGAPREDDQTVLVLRVP